MLTFPLHVTGSTGVSRQSVRNANALSRVEVEVVVEAVGATPSLTFQVEGLVPGGNPATAADWVLLSLLQGDASVATASTPIAVSAVGTTRRFIDGLDKRHFDALAVNVTANTNVTFRSNLNAS